MDVPAGWYPDPASPTTSARWWDGTSWTDHTRGLDDLVAPEQPAAPSYEAPSADTVVVPVAAQSPDFVAPFAPAAPSAYSDTAVYPSGSAYDPTLFPDAAPARSSSPHWGVLALVGALVVVLLVAGVLVVKGLSSGSNAPAASAPTPSAPLTPSQPPPSTDPTTPPGATTPEAIAAGKVLETFKPTTAALPSGVDATLIPGGDVAEGQRTLDGWCSTSYATETVSYTHLTLPTKRIV